MERVDLEWGKEVQLLKHRKLRGRTGTGKQPSPVVAASSDGNKKPTHPRPLVRVIHEWDGDPQDPAIILPADSHDFSTQIITWINLITERYITSKSTIIGCNLISVHQLVPKQLSLYFTPYI